MSRNVIEIDAPIDAVFDVLLDAQAYADLAQPSSAVAPFTYRAVAPNLFNDILSSAMQPDARAMTTTRHSPRKPGRTGLGQRALPTRSS